MISRTAVRFPGLVEGMALAEADLGKRLYNIACLAGPADLSGCLSDVAESICFGGDGRAIWYVSLFRS
jgi:hypothetical protein